MIYYCVYNIYHLDAQHNDLMSSFVVFLYFIKGESLWS